MKVSILTKTVGVIALLSGIAFFAMAYYSYQSDRAYTVVTNEEKAKTIAKFIELSVPHADAFNETFVLSAIEKQLYIYADVVAVSVTTVASDAGKLVLLASSGASASDALLDVTSHTQVFSTREAHTSILSTSEGRMLRVVGVIHSSGKAMGTYQIDLTLAESDRQLGNKYFHDGAIYIGMLIFFVLFLIIAIHIILIRPLSMIRMGLSAVSGGDYSRTIFLHTKDEFEEVAEQFNKMTGVVAKAHNELANHAKDLEEQVSTRTAELEKVKVDLTKVNVDLEGRIALRTKELEDTKKALEITVAERTSELERKVKELEDTNRLMVGREVKMAEMKKQFDQWNKEKGEKA